MADEERSRREVRILPAVLGAAVAVAIAVGVVAYAAGHYGERTKTVTTQAFGSTTTPATYPTVSPQVAAGAHTFVQFACAQCHGMQGQGGVDPAVPALSTVGRSLTVAQLTHIIDHGLGESANPKTPYIPSGRGDLEDAGGRSRGLHSRRPSSRRRHATCVHAARTGARRGRRGSLSPVRLRELSRPKRAGWDRESAVPRQGHPAALRQGFRHDFPTDTAIAAVIRSGSVIGRAPIVSMPHWGGILSNGQIAQLIAYLKTLK
jgi:mono/diheme cytochrome c family protein